MLIECDLRKELCIEEAIMTYKNLPAVFIITEHMFNMKAGFTFLRGPVKEKQFVREG